MATNPVKVLPISYIRSHTREVLRLVDEKNTHVLITCHGKRRGCIIPNRDTRVLWQLQDRPVAEMEQKLKEHYARWLRAKRIHQEGWEGTELDDSRWVPFWGFEKM